ncbi:MAG: hypothetical protein K2Q45_02430 [Nitrosomonas sp.]|nr:hypothetical protein [Nitrosomonas sp.]
MHPREVTNICERDHCTVRQITELTIRQKPAMFVNFFNFDDCAKAKVLLERAFPDVIIEDGRIEKRPLDEVEFELLHSKHDIEEGHLKRYILQFGLSLDSMVPSENSDRRWYLKFNDLRDVDYVIRHIHGERYNGGDVSAKKVIDTDFSASPKPKKAKFQRRR